MSLKINNVLTRQKEEFKPLHKGKVNMYVCGPTVYDYPHIGHAKTYIAFDVVVRYLRYLGYDVLYVQNITDVGHLVGDAEEGEDKIQARARQHSVTPMQLVETYTRIYFENMDALGVVRPDISPRASGHIPEQIEMVKTLIEKGHAYEANGSVYFDVTSYADYGKLSRRRLDEQEEGARLEINSEKRHPSDFAIWKFAEPNHLLRWNSPWGEGFPGWHLECSAMAAKYLGETFDIHGGGIDNIFPHNECEIAQSECAHGAGFSNYWMLTGSLTLEGVKMSKSLGNTLTINDALQVKKWRPEVIRYYMLSAHYSNPVDFSDDEMEAKTKGWQRIHGSYMLTREQMRNAPAGDATADVQTLVDSTKTAFEERMNDDFNTPMATAVLQDFTRTVNGWLNGDTPLNQGSLAAIDRIFTQIGGEVLGILQDDATASSGGDATDNAARLDGVMRLLIDLRANARKNKDWGTADQIRNQLKDLGLALEDRADGTVWKAE